MGLQICLLQGLTCPTSKTEKNTQNLKGPTLSQAHRKVAFKNEHNLLVNNSQCVFKETLIHDHRSIFFTISLQSAFFRNEGILKMTHLCHT